jgi:hypothetical protein
MTEYVLKINSDKKNYQKITDILQVTPSSMRSFWELSIDENNTLYTRAIQYFVDLIELNIQELKNIGITVNDISVWFYKPYEGQCNMEFTPDEMKKLSKNNITLCISCWEV